MMGFGIGKFFCKLFVIMFVKRILIKNLRHII
jgi:hypothetical protein